MPIFSTPSQAALEQSGENRLRGGAQPAPPRSAGEGLVISVNLEKIEVFSSQGECAFTVQYPSNYCIECCLSASVWQGPTVAATLFAFS